MTIKDLATIICKEETESENRNINVLTHFIASPSTFL